MADNQRIDDLRRRVKKDPTSIAFAQLAEECRRARQYQEAVEVCHAGLAIHPGYLSARVTLGRALLEINQLEDARAELELVLKSAPENLAAIRALAETHHRRGNLAEALTQFRAALLLARNDPDLERTVRELSRLVEPPQARSVIVDGLSFEQMQHELLKHVPPPTHPVAPPTPTSTLELPLASSSSASLAPTTPDPQDDGDRLRAEPTVVAAVEQLPTLPALTTSEPQGGADRPLAELAVAAQEAETAEVWSALDAGPPVEHTQNEPPKDGPRLTPASTSLQPELSLSSPWPSLVPTTPEPQDDAARQLAEPSDAARAVEPAEVRRVIEGGLSLDQTQGELLKGALVPTAPVIPESELSLFSPSPSLMLTSSEPQDGTDRRRAELTVAALEQFLAAIHVVRAGRLA